MEDLMGKVDLCTRICGWLACGLASSVALANPDFDQAEQLTRIALCESPNLRIGYSINNRKAYMQQAIGIYAKLLTDESVKTQALTRYEVLNFLLPLATSPDFNNFWDAGTTCPAFHGRYANPKTIFANTIDVTGLRFFAGYADSINPPNKADAFCRYLGHREAASDRASMDLSQASTGWALIFSQGGRIGIFPFKPDPSRKAIYYTTVECRD
jgi:hypothetical protein